MYQNISIIGIGSLGSVIALKLSELSNIQSLTLIDNDFIEYKNLKNSIYSVEYLGDFKVDALKDIINKKNENILINNINKFFNDNDIEDNNLLNNSDLIIDCRDIVINRNNNIDVRLSLSGRFLLIDCRKNVKYDNIYEGSYSSIITINDLIYCADMFQAFFRNNNLNNLIKNNSTYQIYLDAHTLEIGDKIYSSNNPDYLHLSKKIINLENNLNTILDINKSQDIIINSLEKKEIIYQNTNDNIILNKLNEIININSMYNYYFIHLKNNSIHIIPEIGAA